MEKSISNLQFKKMTEEPVGKLIISLGIPTTISMLITNIYNMADSFFVSKISLSAGGATSVVFGLMAILQAFGFMFGHGSGSYISRALGAKDNHKASIYASTGVLWGFLSGLIIQIIGISFLTPLMRLLGSTDTILPYSKHYGLCILIAAPFMTTSCVLNNILRYEGRANLAMIGLTTGGILNIILDPIFIFTFNWGILGAGIATALSQFISFCILSFFFIKGKTQSKLSTKFLTRNLLFLKNIIITGLPSLCRQGLNSVSTMLLNYQCKAYGDAVIASMGYVSRITGLIFSVGLGIGQGFQPFSGYNYGAKKFKRLKEGTLFTLFFGGGFLTVLSICFFIFAPNVISIFRTEQQVIEIGSTALRFYCISLIFFPVSVVTTMLFQSIGKNVSALILSCLQSGLFFIPLCITLTLAFKVLGIQLSQPIAYTLSAFVSTPYLFNFLRKLPKEDE